MTNDIHTNTHTHTHTSKYLHNKINRNTKKKKNKFKKSQNKNAPISNCILNINVFLYDCWFVYGVFSKISAILANSIRCN